MGSNTEEYTIIVEGMSCGHCQNAVEKSVGLLPGVISAKVNLITKTLIVEVDVSKTTLDEIKETVDEAGFTAT